MTTSRPYRVQLVPGLSDRLDALLNPVDSCRAMVQLYRILPLLHERRRRTDAGPDDGGQLVYRGRFGWMELGFSYIEVNEALLVIYQWHDLLLKEERTQEVDFVLDYEAVAMLAAEGELL